MTIETMAVDLKIKEWAGLKLTEARQTLEKLQGEFRDEQDALHYTPIALAESTTLEKMVYAEHMVNLWQRLAVDGDIMTAMRHVVTFLLGGDSSSADPHYVWTYMVQRKASKRWANKCLRALRDAAAAGRQFDIYAAIFAV